MRPWLRSVVLVFLAALPLLVAACSGTPQSGTRAAAAPASSTSRSRERGASWIDYSVSGDGSGSFSEKDTVICRLRRGSQFAVHSVGKWNIDIVAGVKPGDEDHARLTLLPPGPLRDQEMHTDDRAFGPVEVQYKKTGRDPYGIPVFQGEFSSRNAATRGGLKFRIRGRFSCPVFSIPPSGKSPAGSRSRPR